jgi:DNA polymerase-3 subunit alpha
VQKDERGAKILAETIDLLPAAREKYTESITIQLQAATINRQRLDSLKNICHQFHGPCPLLLTLHFPGRGEVDIEIRKDITIRPCQEFADKTRELLGDSVLTFRKKALVAPARKKWSKNGKGASHHGSIKESS